MTWEMALNTGGVVLGLVGLLVAVYSIWEMRRAFARAEVALGQREKAVGVARTAVGVARQTLVALKSREGEDVAINHALDALKLYEREMMPLLGLSPPAAPTASGSVKGS